MYESLEPVGGVLFYKGLSPLTRLACGVPMSGGVSRLAPWVEDVYGYLDASVVCWILGFGVLSEFNGR